MTAFNMNFDSLGWGFSARHERFKDPTFFRIIDRFFEFGQKHNFKYTLFVIGQDLEHPAVAERVKLWCEQGHEIGNHSYTHPQNIGYLSYNKLELEVMKSHEIITRICGKEPRGFIAPSWATSTDLIDVLQKNDYLYDTSLFPSYVLWLAIAQNWWNFRRDPRRRDILQRKDLWANLIGSRTPYLATGKSLTAHQEEGLLVLPLPVTPWLRLPCWHTMAFLLPPSLFQKILTTCLKNYTYFYYLIHPADLITLEDIPRQYQHMTTIHRLEVPLEEKEKLYRNALNIIISLSRNMVTMEEMAQSIINDE